MRVLWVFAPCRSAASQSSVREDIQYKALNYEKASSCRSVCVNIGTSLPASVLEKLEDGIIMVKSEEGPVAKARLNT